MEFKKLLISLNIISTFFVINYVKADTLDLKISHKAVIDDKSNFIGTIIDYYEKNNTILSFVASNLKKQIEQFCNPNQFIVVFYLKPIN